MRPRHHANRIAWGAILSGLAFATIWSLSFVFTKSALTSIPPLWLAALRLLLAGGALLACRGVPILRFLRGGLPLPSLMRVIAAGVLSQAAYLGASYWALLQLPSSIVNIVVSSLPLMTLPISYLLLHEQIGTNGIVAFVVSMVGVMITLDGGWLAAGAGQHYDTLAVILLTASVLALAFGNVLIKPMISRSSLTPFCALQFIAGGVAAAVAAQILEPGSLPSWDAVLGSAPALAFLAFIGSILGTLLWFQVLHSMSANAASSFFLFTPVFGITLGAIAFGEPVTHTKIIGILVISLAITLRFKEIPIFGGSAASSAAKEDG